ncbi:MAG: hydratase [Colwellia sp.]
MTNKNKFSLAAAELLSRRIAGTKAPRLPTNIRPNTLDEALEIQAQLTMMRNDKVAGWKCLLPFDDKVIVAPIFSDNIESGDICRLFIDDNKARLEPEIAFILNKNLPAQQADYSEEEIDSAISSCHMALELIQSRFADDSGADFTEKLADGLVNHGLYIGPEINREKAFAASKVNLSVTQGCNTQNFEGVHPNPLPQLPVYWLINYMSKRGINFEAGQAIITGSYAGIVEVDFDVETKINYENLGEYQVTFKQL